MRIFMKVFRNAYICPTQIVFFVKPFVLMGIIGNLCSSFVGGLVDFQYIH